MTAPTETEQGERKDIHDRVLSILGGPQEEREAALEEFCRELPEKEREIRKRYKDLSRSGKAGLVFKEGRIPREVGGYEVQKELGRGSMGVVYLVKDPKDGGEAVLKAMSPRWTMSTKARDRFREEVGKMARVLHPRIVPILDMGEDEGLPWFAMKKMEGVTLQAMFDALKEKGIGLSQVKGTDLGNIIFGRRIDKDFEKTWGGDYYQTVAKLVRSAAEALHHAHENGLIHRDLRPSNLMLGGQCHAHLIDFGLSRIEAEQVWNMTGKYIGNPYYLSPEQTRMESEDRRTDVFSLGILLFQLLTWRLPFPGKTPGQVFKAIRRKEAPLPWKWNPEVPRRLGRICLMALEKDPERRYQGMEEMATDLDRFLKGGQVQARGPSAFRRAGSWCKQRPWLAGLLAVPLFLWVLGQVGEEDSGTRSKGGGSFARGGSSGGSGFGTGQTGRRQGKGRVVLRGARLLARTIARLVIRARGGKPGKARVAFVGFRDRSEKGEPDLPGEMDRQLVHLSMNTREIDLFSRKRTESVLRSLEIAREDLVFSGPLKRLETALEAKVDYLLGATLTEVEEEGLTRKLVTLELLELLSRRVLKANLYLTPSLPPSLDQCVKKAANRLHLWASEAFGPGTCLGSLGIGPAGEKGPVPHANQVLEVELCKLPGVTLVPASVLRHGMESLGLNEIAIRKPDGRQKLSHALGVNLEFLLSGTLLIEDERYRLRLLLIDARTGRVLRTIREETERR